MLKACLVVWLGLTANACGGDVEVVAAPSGRVFVPDEILASLPPAQSEILVDEWIEHVEYSSAVDAALDCIEAAGGTVDYVELASDGVIDYAWSAGSDDIAAAGHDCIDEWLFWVETIYGSQISIVGPQVLEAMEELWSCLNDGAPPAFERAAFAQLQYELPERFATCSQAMG